MITVTYLNIIGLAGKCESFYHNDIILKIKIIIKRQCQYHKNIIYLMNKILFYFIFLFAYLDYQVSTEPSGPSEKLIKNSS